MNRNVLLILFMFGATPAYAATIIPAHYPKIEVMEKYIMEEAPKYGIDPKIAVKVAQSEGLNKAGEHVGFMTKDVGARYSFGPFQLRMDGFGNNFDFGKKPTNLNWKAQIDYALNIAKNHGWGGWAGAAAVGVSDHCGIAKGECVIPWETTIHEDYKRLMKPVSGKTLDSVNKHSHSPLVVPPTDAPPKPLKKAPIRNKPIVVAPANKS